MDTGSVLSPHTDFLPFTVNRPLTFGGSAVLSRRICALEQYAGRCRWSRPAAPVPFAGRRLVFAGHVTVMFQAVARGLYLRKSNRRYKYNMFKTYDDHFHADDLMPARENTNCTAAPHNSDGITIGELSRESGVTLRALRFYQSKGLLTPQRNGVSRVFPSRIAPVWP